MNYTQTILIPNNPAPMSYEEFIIKNCNASASYMDFLVMLFAVMVFVYLIIQLINSKVDYEPLKVITYFINFIAEYIMFVCSILLFVFYFVKAGEAELVQLFSVIGSIVILVSIVSIIYFWLSIPKNRKKVIAIFKSTDDTPNAKISGSANGAGEVLKWQRKN